LPETRSLPGRSLRSGVVARRFAHQNPRAPHLAPTGCLTLSDTQRHRAMFASTTCSGERNCASVQAMKTRIPGLKQYQGRNPNGYFQNLDCSERQRAYYWLGVFCKRWGRNLPQWRFAILVGQASRLARNPRTSAWGRSMLAKRGGKAVQRKYRHEGRRPTEIATQVRRADARMRKDSEERKRQGLPPRSSHGFTVGNEP